MLNPDWEMHHVCLAVADFERSMRDYTEAYGIEWGTEHPPVGILPSDIFEDGLDFRGYRSIYSKVNATNPLVLQLSYSEPGSPTAALYGCPDGRDHFHHMAYLVDDIASVAGHLEDVGFVREFYFQLPDDGSLLGGYFRSPAGMRIEVGSKELRPAVE